MEKKTEGREKTTSNQKDGPETRGIQTAKEKTKTSHKAREDNGRGTRCQGMKNCARKTEANPERNTGAKEEEAKPRRTKGGCCEKRKGNSRTIAGGQKEPCPTKNQNRT